MSFDECLQVLGLEKGYTDEQLKTAYRNSALVWHPDRFQNQNKELKKRAEKEMQRVNEAFQSLKSNRFTYSQHSSSPPPTPKSKPKASSETPPNATHPPYSPPYQSEEEKSAMNATKLKQAMRKPTRNFRILGVICFLIALSSPNPQKDGEPVSLVASIAVWTLIGYWIWYVRERKKVRVRLGMK